MRFLKIITVLLLFEEYQCSTEMSSINATHCEYTTKRQIKGKWLAENVTSIITFTVRDKGNQTTVGRKVAVKTVMRPAVKAITKVNCCPGYIKGRRKGTCTPKCDDFCENSVCTAPNECSCKEGFERFSPTRCVPYCDSCEKGRCIGPNICECYSGYHKNETGQCVPTCQDSCLHGWCSAPDECTCHPGYELDEAKPFKCNPKCALQCIQGSCTAPDVCDCHPGYEFKKGSTNECLPICDFCESGNCTGPSNCTCWPNYEGKEIIQGTNIVKICQPKCKNDCINGYCVEVDTCSCKRGYDFVKDSLHECEPVCDPQCENGICVKPNQCLCDDGYKNIDDQCQAHCDNECVNGFCLFPNQCECEDGYEFKFNSTNVCEALCENCTNGMCVAPNVCECLGGYKLTENNVCERICQPECIFGECVNGTCVCEDGLQLINGTCVVDSNIPEWEDVVETTTNVEVVIETTEHVESQPYDPICGTNNESCTNGTCISPGECKCFDGYEINPSNSFECVLGIITASESTPDPVTANIANYVSFIVALLIVGLTGTTLIILLYRWNCKVNYNVDEKERKVGVNEEDYVHYITNKEDSAFA